ncbi:MAG: 50S ribosomal protein L23 [Dethiobacteria bacterium]|jgi:large subunit ribosomal protein L23|nr:50S ribosomal protein L23 [Bacillota bacterium]NMD34056.1 50S ribosomal protein L23 [Bacillota bacterium]HOB29098.1 50S ribosomal protein L23 [Bacillota bacterium]HPZ41670.1 50S ribosomal protein L23 [Bacillota bacterium]HQD52276.1 50S ribosomal protein L23 [Bacillota bacterium]
MKDPRDIIVRPVITEKSMQLLEDNKYTFVVAREANKIEIKRALEEIFNVKVKAVNTANFKGKKKRLGRYPYGYKPRWKKAIVTLAEGSKPIELFEGR